jgi:5'-deoxynucleotidase YfbR-like HD superfamily hydrolase
MSTADLINLPITIFGTNREARRIRDLERVLRFDQAERVIHRNNLHTHMLRVSYLSKDLATHLQTMYDLKVDPLKTQRLALYHDDPEVITGDIPTPIKYGMKPHERLKLRKAEAEAVRSLATRYFGINPLNRKRRQYLADQHDMTQKQSIEARIVNIADKIEGLCETLHEIRCGNETFYPILNNYRTFFKTFIPNEPLFDLVNADPMYKISLETIPTDDEARRLPKILLDDYKNDQTDFWQKVLANDLPSFYLQWLEVTKTKLSPQALFPGWKKELK